jgi:hypothetical protein
MELPQEESMNLERKAAWGMGSQALLGRVCKPEDISDAIRGLLEGSGMLTGQVLGVDCGLGIAS